MGNDISSNLMMLVMLLTYNNIGIGWLVGRVTGNWISRLQSEKAVFHQADFSARSGISRCLFSSQDKEKFRSAGNIPPSGKRL
jgi:hypothetical protein